MRRRSLLNVALLSPALFSVSRALASNVLETQTFVLTLPSGWERDLGTDPVSARGPQGELLQISSSRIAGPPGGSSELAEVRARIKGAGLRTLRLGEAEAELRVEKAVTRTVLSDSVELHEVVYHARDTGWKLAQFFVLGPRVAILVSLRIPGERVPSIEAVRGSVLRIKWVAS